MSGLVPSRHAPSLQTVRRIGDSWTESMAAIRPAWLNDDILRGLRWGLTTLWMLAFGYQCWNAGLPLFRSDLLVWLCALLVAMSVGKRGLFTIVLDFLPFAAVLVAYDYVSGLADRLGMPTWWHPQIDVDKFLFFGHEPTVWLQEHLKHPDVQWYDIVVGLCYCSFFLLPYVVAFVMWWRSRADFYRWGLRFVALSFLGFGIFALIPSAPPWAAATCTSAQVAGRPNFPECLTSGGGIHPGNLLGSFTTHQPGANPWVERISVRGLYAVHANLGFIDVRLRFAAAVIKAGQGGVDAVAAVPSLHVGGTVLFSLFMWHRVRRWWRPVLVAYPLLMTFSLVYSAEHYVCDCIAGALLAWLVHAVANRIEQRRKRSGALDTLESPPGANEPGHVIPEQQESECPPIATPPHATPSRALPHATTPSSI